MRSEPVPGLVTNSCAVRGPERRGHFYVERVYQELALRRSLASVIQDYISSRALAGKPLGLSRFHLCEQVSPCAERQASRVAIQALKGTHKCPYCKSGPQN